jgi:Curlin associated repeat
MIRANLAACLLAFTVGAAAIDAPIRAAAAGSVSVTVTPKGESAHALRDGLFLFSWAQQLRNYARVDQKGSGNGAAVSQTGYWNWATIFQRGRGHSATVAQTGNNNAVGVFQFGRNTSMDATQTGNGQAGLMLQYGW